jgi:hypothetical protein
MYTTRHQKSADHFVCNFLLVVPEKKKSRQNEIADPFCLLTH